MTPTIVEKEVIIHPMDTKYFLQFNIFILNYIKFIFIKKINLNFYQLQLVFWL